MRNKNKMSSIFSGITKKNTLKD